MSETTSTSGIPDLSSELAFLTSRSSGKGGQHVNKTETRVDLHFNIPESKLLTTEQKELLMAKLAHRLTINGVLIVTARRSRSQQANKEDAVRRFYALMEKSLKPAKKRVKTKPGKAVNEARLAEKKEVSQKKELRKPPL
ncbi:MAG TPA: alternative ribosome rescue aminoacyl-tRNA hydrolase ArfB [Lentimicrobium sp.]|jgi:ribosome-associated protein|nr:alternative ribosome rescue aminoacyl-tRNA hydrolase ArfB [Lentimicrobium sp.]